MVGTSNLGSWHSHWCLDLRQSSFEASVDSRHFLVEPPLGFRPSGGHRFLKQTFCECYYPLPPLPRIGESHFTSVIMKMNNCFHSFCILCLFRVVELVHGGGWMSNLPALAGGLFFQRLLVLPRALWPNGYIPGLYPRLGCTNFINPSYGCLEAGISPKLSSLPSCFPYFNGPFWGVT
jgi:hypothetical protein